MTRSTALLLALLSACSPDLSICDRSPVDVTTAAELWGLPLSCTGPGTIRVVVSPDPCGRGAEGWEGCPTGTDRWPIVQLSPRGALHPDADLLLAHEVGHVVQYVEHGSVWHDDDPCSVMSAGPGVWDADCIRGSAKSADFAKTGSE
jgi:hypothetical protein